MNTIKVLAVFALAAFGAIASASDFPTSSVTPKSQWKEMHTDGFTGSTQDACNLIRLNATECASYASMHSAGECEVKLVPNGTKLDTMGFTKDGKHYSQNAVEVALKNPSSREAEVCMVGKKAVIRFHGCNNPSVVNEWHLAPKPVARALPPAETFVDVYPAAGTCSWGPRNSRYVAVHMMEPATAQHQCAVDHMLSQDGMVEVPEGTTPPVLGGPGKPTGKEFSQMCGELVHKERFAFGTEVHEGVTMFIKDAHSNQKWRIFEGQQIGNRLVSSGLGADLLAAGGLVLRIPDEYDNIDGDVYAIFSDQSKVRTPAPSGVWEKLSSFKRDCDARILTGIDAVPGAPASAPATSSTAGASMNGSGLAQQ